MRRFIIWFVGLATSSGLIYAQPSNDDCANAIDIGDISSTQSFTADFTLATESMDASCETANSNNRDLWYQVTMPYDGNILVDGISGIDRVTLFSQCGGMELSCRAGDQLIESLSGGQVYLIRFSTSLSNHTVMPEVTAFSLASHDDCQGAIAINNLAIEQSISLDARMATQSLTLTCDPEPTGNVDLWFVFTMPFDGRIIVDGVSILIRIGLVQGCGGVVTEIDCKSGGGYFDNLLGGELYYLRYAVPSNFATADNFTIQAFDLVAHDDCMTPLNLGDITSQISVMADTRHATESLDASCETNPDNLDLWYTFTMPFDGSVRVTGVFGVNRIAFFTTCSNEIHCFLGSGFAYNLVGGQNYLLRYASIPQHGLNDEFFVQAFAPPPHDVCAAAIDLGDISMQTVVDLDVREATESLNATCENPLEDNLDLWYQFTMPFTGKVHVTGVFGVNKITLFDACSGNEISCQSGNAFFYGLQNGQIYWLRYAAISNQATADQIMVQAFPPPPNDECTAPLIIANIDQVQTISLDIREATESLVASCENAGDNNLDLWYQFDMPYEGNLKISGVFGVNRVSIFDDCGTELSCQIGNGLFFALPSGNYFLRYAAIENQAGVDEFNVQAFALASNDDCINAFSLGNISSAQSIQVNSASGTEQIDGTCEIAGDDNIDLWYSFTMPLDGQVDIGDANAAYHFTLFEQCITAEIACFNGNGSFLNLSSGNSYLLRYSCPAQNSGLDGFSFEAATSLPVELVLFRADDMQESGVKLIWETASEINNHGFFIERSSDTKIWDAIHWMTAKGDEDKSYRYEWIDRMPFSGLNYYRLVQEDFDGSRTLSQMAEVKYGSNNLKVRVFPNPTSNILTVDGSIDKEEFVIYNMQGQEMPIDLITDRQLNIAQYLEGVYLLSKRDDPTFAAVKFLVRK